MALPIEILADLQLTVDGEDIEIRGDGDRIVVDLPTLRAGRRLVQSGPFVLADREVQLNRLHTSMAAAGISVDVRLQGQSIARLGEGAQPGLTSRLLGLGKVEVRPTRPVVQAFRRRPLLTAAVVVGLLLLIGWLVRRPGDK